MQIVLPSANLLWETPDMESVIERAARTCYKSESKGEDSGQWVKRVLIMSGHHAMLEHASLSYSFVVDRGVSHELVRHRLCAFAQESTRYCNYGKERFGAEISVIEPPDLNPEQRRHWVTACEEAEKAYLAMIDHGCSAQIARSVLPTCTKTEIVCTANVREWRHILQMRCSKNAHPQIRQVMLDVYADLTIRHPHLFEMTSGIKG